MSDEEKEVKEKEEVEPSISIKGSFIFEMLINPAFNELKDAKKLPGIVKVRIGRIFAWMKDELEILSKQRDEFVKKYSMKDEDGKPIRLPNGGVRMEDSDSYEKEMKELNEEVYTSNLTRPKIKMAKLSELSTGAIMILDVIGNIKEEEED